MPIPQFIRNLYNRDQLATVAYGWNIAPYIPAVGLNTLAKFESGFQNLANGYSNLITSNFDPMAALGFGFLRMLEGANNRIGNNKYINLFRAAGCGIYTISSLANILGMFASGPDFLDFINLTSNSLFAAELYSEVSGSLNRRNSSLIQDVQGVAGDLEGIVRRFNNLRGNRQQYDDW